jgi:hypothetical protein
MLPRILAMSLLVLLSACKAKQGSEPKAPAAPTQQATPVQAAPSPEAAVTGERSLPTISSAQLVQDCPDPKPEVSDSSADPLQDPPVGRLVRPDGSYTGPCDQSNLQLTFTRAGVIGQKVELKELRLLTVDGKLLSELSARLPSTWSDNGYESWNGVLALGSNAEVSYKLSVPDWEAVEVVLGGSSDAAMFVLEVDVDIDGVTTRVRSPQFARARPEMSRT